jgi:hypothetical protein
VVSSGSPQPGGREDAHLRDRSVLVSDQDQTGARKTPGATAINAIRPTSPPLSSGTASHRRTLKSAADRAAQAIAAPV